ncbi:MAG: RluA family pseudouridine synthase [Candidatus Nanopelagicales bacterium]|nr:RluA family pseudouridine synthase [Candidatus Nanopelagicales bacterium]
MTDISRFPVPPALVGERVDVALSRLIGLSRTKSADLIDLGAVTLAGKPVNRSHRLLESDVLEVDLGRSAPAAENLEPQVGIAVLYEDEDLVVVDKPVGMAAHPSPGWRGPTVVGSLRFLGISLASVGAAEREGVVHRLDAGTTGVMVVAKSVAAYTGLKEQFRQREVEKIYHTLVQGHPDPSRGTIDAPVGRHPRHEHRFAVVTAGRDAVTHYETIEAFRRASLLAIRLETGRTHQIRVHMSAVHHPCCGDLVYGADPRLADDLGLERQWLHAVELGLRHPITGSSMRFRSEYPADLADALTRCRGWS